MASQLKANSRGAQFCGRFGNLRFRTLFGGRDPRPAPRAEQRRGDAGARQTHDQYLFAREFDSRLQPFTSI
jgi:hypothetical protein